MSIEVARRVALAFIHNLIAHPLLAITGEADWAVRFHDWTAALAWPKDENGTHR